MKKTLTILILVFCIFSSGFSKVAYTDEELFEEGLYFIDRYDFIEAEVFLKQLVEKHPDNAHYNFLLGECYLNIENQEHMAIPFLEKSTSSIISKKDFKRKSFDEPNAPLHAYFYLGNAYRFNNQLTKALEAYEIFVSSPLYPYNYNDNIVDNEVASSKRASIIKEAKINISTAYLPEIINSGLEERRPIISDDGNTLVFIRSMKFYDAVFCTVKNKEGEWLEPFNITSQIKSDGDFYPVCLNEDGTKLLLTSKVMGSSDIFVSRLENNKWQAAELLTKKISSGKEELSACFGETTDEVYFTSNRKGGSGGYDIYYIKFSRSEYKWLKPEPVTILNTEFDEQTVFYNKKCKTIYFASQGHNNMGGFDIFYAKRKGKSWEEPKNIGYPINTTRNNLYFQPLNDCSSGLMSVPDSITGKNKKIATIRIEP